MSRFSQKDQPLYQLTTTGENRESNRIKYNPTKIIVYHSDINTNFQYTSSSLIVKGKSALDNQISNILSTPIGSDQFEPLYGSNLPFRLHDPINAFTASLIKQDSIEAINTWMFGVIDVDFNRSSVEELATDEGYSIIITYSTDTLGITQSFQANILR
jgi:phage baseplate assembly protein W